MTVDGVPITGPNSPMPIQSGALAGYAALRDTLAPQYQAQLDQIAGGLINAFAESDQTAPALPRCQACSPRRGDQPALDVGDDGLAADIEVNPKSTVAGRQSESVARRRHQTPEPSLYLQHDRRGELYRTHSAAHRPDQRDAELRPVGRPRLIVVSPITPMPR